MSPLPPARMRAAPESWLIASRSLSPLPFMALAALSMKRLRDVPDASVTGPRSVASRVS
jgi:hypothetical protein